MDKRQEVELYRFIDKTVWEVWDPIDISKFGGPRNEYYGYLPTIQKLVIENKSEEEIARYLLTIERDRFGLAGNYERCLLVSRDIITKKEMLINEGS